MSVRSYSSRTYLVCATLKACFKALSVDADISTSTYRNFFLLLVLRSWGGQLKILDDPQKKNVFQFSILISLVRTLSSEKSDCLYQANG